MSMPIARVHVLLGQFILIFIFLVLVILVFRSCAASADEAAQAKQDARGAEAYADAATVAVAQVTNQAQAEADLDALARQAMEKIDNAQDPVAARAAVDAALCGLRLYRDRPECAVQPTRP